MFGSRGLGGGVGRRWTRGDGVCTFTPGQELAYTLLCRIAFSEGDCCPVGLEGVGGSSARSRDVFGEGCSLSLQYANADCDLDMIFYVFT